MRAIAGKFVAVSLIALAATGSARAGDLTPLQLSTDSSDPYQNTHDGTLNLVSELQNVTSFVQALQASWASYSSATAFESAIESYFSATTHQTLNSSWLSSNTVVWSGGATNWSVTFNPTTAVFTASSPGSASFSGSLSAPGPIAGSGVLGLIAAAGLAGLAIRKRSESVARG